MSTYTIKKGKHWPWTWPFGLYLFKKRIAFRIFFNSSCKYFLPGEDMGDINKLFGIGYFPHHHKESARVGWRYNENLNKVEIFSYCYVNGNRVTELITTVSLNNWFDAELIINRYDYTFCIIKTGVEFNSVVKKTHNKKIGYWLNPYFGGNTAAPHSVTIEMKKA